MQEFGLALDHVHGKRGEFVELYLSSSELARVQQAGFQCDILIEDWDRYYAERRQALHKKAWAPARPLPRGFELGSMGGFYTFEEVIAQLDSMRLMYPNLISVKSSIGESHQERDLWVVKISSSPDAQRDKPEALYTGLLHAREPQGMMLLMYFMYYLLEQYGTDPEVTYLLDNRELYFIPVMNPDGYVRNRTTNPNGGGMWRKNARDSDTSGTITSVDGVDLNRNFSYQWGISSGSSGSLGNDAYRGPSAFSEPETQALRDFCNQQNFRAAINYHTYSNLWIVPFAYNSAETADSLIYREISREMVRKNGYTNGTVLQTIGYLASGDSDDWMYGEHIPKIFAMSPEVGTHLDGFWPDDERIITLAEENVEANLIAAWVAGAYVVPTKLERGKDFPKAGDTVSVSVRLKNKGVAETATQLSLELLSQSPFVQITKGGVSLQDVTSQAETQTAGGALEFVVQPGYAQGDQATLELRFHQNGGFIKKQFSVQLGDTVQLLADDAELSDSTWVFTGNWGRDSSFAYQGRYSFKDRPYGNSKNSDSSSMTIRAPLNLSGMRKATLMFQTHYAIESLYDFAQVLVSTDTGKTWLPLKGLLTGEGSGAGQKQKAFEPGYDGTIYQWEREEMSLDAYAGKPAIWLRFQFASDQGVTMRGWYVDDIQVVGYRSSVTIVEQRTAPHRFSLEQNYPNPFNPSTNVKFRVGAQHAVSVQLKVFDLLGREITTLVNEKLGSGEYNVQWFAENYPSGVYFYRLEAGSFVETRKMILLK